MLWLELPSFCTITGKIVLAQTFYSGYYSRTP